MGEADKLGLYLVFLPPCSHDLNPIEFLWKSLKKLISEVFIDSVQSLKAFIKEKYAILCRNPGYARSWIGKFSATFQEIFGRGFYNLLSE